MTNADQLAQMNALIEFMFSTPPVDETPETTITTNMVHIAPSGDPRVEIDGVQNTVVGIKSTGWVMVSGLGWRRIHDFDRATGKRMAGACNRLQSRIIADREAVLAALRSGRSRKVNTQ